MLISLVQQKEIVLVAGVNRQVVTSSLCTSFVHGMQPHTEEQRDTHIDNNSIGS